MPKKPPNPPSPKEVAEKVKQMLDPLDFFPGFPDGSDARPSTLSDFLEPDETLEGAEIPSIEKAGDKWAKHTARGLVNTFAPPGISEREKERKIENLYKKLKPGIEEWESSTEKGIMDWVLGE